MLGTIEELEKEIEQFQNNMKASGELVSLLKQMLDQVKRQNETFNRQSDALISRVDSLPGTIENANAESNRRVKENVSSELAQALQDFSDEQNRYLTGLEQTRQQIQNGMDRSETQEKHFNEQINGFLEKLDSSIIQIRSGVKEDVSSELAQVLQEFSNEQNRYLTGLEQTKEQIQNCMDRSEAQEKLFDEKTSGLFRKIDSAIDQIQNGNAKTSDDLKSAVDKILADRNADLVTEQQKYISSIQQVDQSIKSAEEKLEKTYGEFIDMLMKMNISNLYDQNQQLKDELTKRTTILTVISVIGVILGIIGFFL